VRMPDILALDNSQADHTIVERQSVWLYQGCVFASTSACASMSSSGAKRMSRCVSNALSASTMTSEPAGAWGVAEQPPNRGPLFHPVLLAMAGTLQPHGRS
jgi:hypothetical protein